MGCHPLAAVIAKKENKFIILDTNICTNLKHKIESN